MPQDVQVLQCFSCETFQVDIVKKVPKWTCKMCGEKQSVQKVYGKGTGRDCRVLVQSLNEQRLTKMKNTPIVDDTAAERNEDPNFGKGSTNTLTGVVDCNLMEMRGSNGCGPKRSKWSEFTDEELKQSEIHCKVAKTESFETNQQTQIATSCHQDTDDAHDNIFKNESKDLDSFFTL